MVFGRKRCARNAWQVDASHDDKKTVKDHWGGREKNGYDDRARSGGHCCRAEYCTLGNIYRCQSSKFVRIGGRWYWGPASRDGYVRKAVLCCCERDYGSRRHGDSRRIARSDCSRDTEAPEHVVHTDGRFAWSLEGPRESLFISWAVSSCQSNGPWCVIFFPIVFPSV